MLVGGGGSQLLPGRAETGIRIPDIGSGPALSGLQTLKTGYPSYPNQSIICIDLIVFLSFPNLSFIMVPSKLCFPVALSTIKDKIVQKISETAVFISRLHISRSKLLLCNHLNNGY